jgi:hypothetical protein
VLSSTNLTTWDTLNLVDNPLGGVFFTEVTAHLSPRKVYRALIQSPPANMVFVAPSAFTMGSPTSDSLAGSDLRGRSCYLGFASYGP